MNFIKTALTLTKGKQYVNEECWKITGIHSKFRLFGQTLSNFELWKSNTNNFENRGLSLVAYKVFGNISKA